ncbi:hypothetical protein POSPLADRAFT_1045087 [Postia placenta MAD-698-R-SB12]|uniref:Uncharacterized protein n=1 Tax=Postia placenta MAD-698-R-SB12 TaxID=670580 RepID=A0A1X6N5Q1_9APHY|nr:hypothetical protein POSPLADRAFT_1045087 [Postia placenta MAD-698-R-SB12]OSX63934.1 hypothetical protein POSPLADRAFT_1045087 [Postia placenta MAD-698-R-SB12]
MTRYVRLCGGIFLDDQSSRVTPTGDDVDDQNNWSVFNYTRSLRGESKMTREIVHLEKGCLLSTSTAQHRDHRV